MAVGRPIELTPELVAQTISAIADTLYIETAAALLGIHKDTFYDWLKRGARERRRRDRGAPPRPSEDIFVAFSDSVKIGLAEAERRDLEIIAKAAKAGAWQAAAWRLERSRPQRWGRESRELRELRKKVDDLIAQANGAKLSHEADGDRQ